MKIDLAITDDQTINVFIEIKENELAGMLQKQVKSDLNEVKARVEKHMGFRLDENTSVKDYYSYLKILEKDYKQKLKNGQE